MTGSSGSILIVDDDPGIRRALGSTLTALGYKTDEASSGEHGIDLATRNPYDAILLDINMPGRGGIETCRDLRRRLPAAGILMVTVRDSEDDKVEALEAGADDFITKPFVMPELTARIRAIRRGRTITAAKPDLIVIGDITLDRPRRQVTKAGRPVHLTPREFDVLEYLMSHEGAPVRHEQLLRAVWGRITAVRWSICARLCGCCERKSRITPQNRLTSGQIRSLGIVFAVWMSKAAVPPARLRRSGVGNQHI
jgi:two-component system, OmpR family, KDP operon response regulator KdpE